MGNSLVSVLIPAYNHEKYVQDTIKSIINQTYQNIELIIVDDGSKDSTWQRIQEMKTECEKRFVRVHFETKVNEGTCKTFNRLIDLANGAYVYLIASDDIAKPDAIQCEIEFLLQNSEYGFVVGNNEIIDSNNNVCYWDEKQNIVYESDKAFVKTFGEWLQNVRKDVNFLTDDFGTYSSLYQGNYIPNGYLIRKKIFDNIRFTPKAPLEDYYLMLQVAKRYKMKYLNKILFSYRWHDSNTIKQTQKIQEYTFQTMKYEEEILNNLRDKNISKDILLIKKYGVLYKRIGIPYLFCIEIYRSWDTKTAFLKLFNIPIFRYEKSIKR